MADPVNVALIDAYNALPYHEREYMIGRLRDSALGIQRRITPTNTRWQPRHRDEILQDCEQGLFLRLGIFLDSMYADGLVDGLLDTRTAGMLRRPCVFSGDPWLCETLKGREAVTDSAGAVVEPERPGVFKRLCPTAEFSAILRDGIMAGIGLGELRDDGTGLPVARHLDLHWLRQEYMPDRLIYQSPGGTYEIREGDGRWIVFRPKRRDRFWMAGKWYPCAMPAISRAGTELDRLRWQGQLADALRAVRTSGATTEPQRKKLLAWVRDQWHRAAAFVGRPDEEAYLVESNGIGYQIFDKSDASAEVRIRFALTGNQATSGAGALGFGDGDGFFDISDNINQETAESAAECAVRDIIAPWARRFWGECNPRAVMVSWDVRSPRAQKTAFEAVRLAVTTVTALDAMAAPRSQEVDLEAFEAEYRVVLPLRPKGGTVPPQLPPAGSAPEEDEPAEDHAARLAAEMTEHGLERCEHGRANRCPLCGVERERGVECGDDGQTTWRLAWRPIGRVGR